MPEKQMPDGVGEEDVTFEEVPSDGAVAVDGTDEEATGEKEPEIPENVSPAVRKLIEGMRTNKKELNNIVEGKQLVELKEWRDSDFKSSMREIIAAQQEICSGEGDPEAADSDGKPIGSCALGTKIWQEMFQEPWSAEKADASEA
ncbi:MAG: hypothetical protein NTW50_05130 [Candidatus Berkelbacteria bacterium]|nr:hypothetical protein [Candidatus Berkelbacteria bacterium]